MGRSSTDSKDKHHRKASRSRFDGGTHQPQASKIYSVPARQPLPIPPLPTTSFKFPINKPQAIVVDLLGVLVCKSFMTSSKEFRDFFQHNVLEYLDENWKQKQLKIMINFFRCSQANVPDDYKLAERDETKEEQVKQAKRHVIWKLRNDPTNSALSLFMLGITEWGYKSKTLVTNVYDDVPSVLESWSQQHKIPVYVGVGSADFLVLVLSNTIYGDLLNLFSGHMNIMDFDGTRANKDFRRLASILHLPADKILYLTRFRQDCRRALENGLQSLILLRPDFDSHGLINKIKNKRTTSNNNTVDGYKLAPRGRDESNSPPNRMAGIPGGGLDQKFNDIRQQIASSIAPLSLIEDHEEVDKTGAISSQIVEQDLTKYNVILSLAEISFR